MTMQRRATASVLIWAVALVVIRLTESDARYTFGHPRALDRAVLGLLLGLAATHAVIALIMWLQRARWTPSEAWMFLFIAAKVLFWASFGHDYTASGRGVRLDYAFLWVLMATTTAGLDWKLFARYILGHEDAYLFPNDQPETKGEDRVIYEGIEKRSGPPGRRFGDTR